MNAGFSKSKISVLIGIHRCIIGREVDRNIHKRGVEAKVYIASKAEQKNKNKVYWKIIIWLCISQ